MTFDQVEPIMRLLTQVPPLMFLAAVLLVVVVSFLGVRTIVRKVMK
jgi:hypothetical protein